MRKFGISAALVLVCAWGVRADALPAPGAMLGSFWSSTASVWDGAYMLSAHDFLSVSAESQIKSAADTQAGDLLAAATANVNSLSMQSVNDPAGDVLGPLLSVPEPNTLFLISIPLLFAVATFCRKRCALR